MALITIAELKAVKPISSSTDAAKLNGFIDDAEKRDLMPLLGNVFYKWIVDNTTDPNAAIVLNKHSYSYSGNMYVHFGLKAILIEFAYARYRFFGSERDTPFGVVDKVYKDGQNASRDRKKELYTDSKKAASQFWIDVRDFLNRNLENYPEWATTCGQDRYNSVNTFKLTHYR